MKFLIRFLLCLEAVCTLLGAAMFGKTGAIAGAFLGFGAVVAMVILLWRGES